MQLDEAAVNFKRAAKVLLKKATDVKKPLGYTAYLRAVVQGNSEQATYLRSTKTYMVDASQAMQDLIDMAGRGKYEDETMTRPIAEAMASMNIASFMKVSAGPMARPRTMLPFNQWEETDDGDEEVEVAQMLRTGVQSDHTAPTFREDAPERAELADMGVEFVPKRENGYFDPMAEGRTSGANLRTAEFMKLLKSKGRAAVWGDRVVPSFIVFKAKGAGLVAPVTKDWRGTKTVKKYGPGDYIGTIGGTGGADAAVKVMSLADIHKRASSNLGQVWFKKKMDPKAAAKKKKDLRTGGEYGDPVVGDPHKGASFFDPVKYLNARDLAKVFPAGLLKSHGVKVKGAKESSVAEGSQQMTEGGWSKFMRRVKSKARKGELGSFLKSPEGKAGRAKAKHGRGQDERLKKRGYKVGPMDDVQVSASILSEKRKLHPSMKKHTNSPKFKAHVGDADDSEPPYYKGKGIQKKEDAPVGAAVLREGTSEMSYDSARTDRKLAKNNLKRAQQKGDESLIAKWQRKFDAATANVAKYKKVAQASRRARAKSFKP